MVAQVVGVGRTGEPRAQPLPEGQPLRHRPRPLVGPHAQHRGVEDVRRPLRPRVPVRRGRGRPPGRERPYRVELRPQGLPGRTPAGAAPAVHRGVREGGHEDRAQEVGQSPPPPVVQRARPVDPGVQADLHRRRLAHHRPPGRARPVERGLHRVVPRLVEDPAARRLPGVHPVTAEGEAERPQRAPHRPQVGGERVQALHEGSGGPRAELQLTAGFERQGRHQGQGPYGVEGRREPLRPHGQPGVPQLVDQPLQLHPHGAGRAGLEADTSQQFLRLRLGERGAATRYAARRHPCTSWSSGDRPRDGPSRERDPGRTGKQTSGDGAPGTPLVPPKATTERRARAPRTGRTRSPRPRPSGFPRRHGNIHTRHGPARTRCPEPAKTSCPEPRSPLSRTGQNQLSRTAEPAVPNRPKPVVPNRTKRSCWRP